MAFGEKTPRQRMINILYLVLLALLALTIPDSILEAFKNINNSLEMSKTNVENSVNELFSAFEKTKLKDDPQRAKPLYEKAKMAKNIIADLDNYIEDIKKEFLLQGGGINEETGDLKHRENEDIAPDIMINHKKGVELNNRINTTREKLLVLLTSEQKNPSPFR